MSAARAHFDGIVTDNLYGDIITDLAAPITGGIGLAASGNVSPVRTAPSMFEPVHGSAPDIAGQQKADPTAAILRSEEHTSELQSLMRISYAVFCLKKKKNKTKHNNKHQLTNSIYSEIDSIQVSSIRNA